MKTLHACWSERDMPAAEYDCRKCGACCVQLGPYDGTAYVYLDKDEAHRMRSHGLPVVRTSMGGLCLGAMPHKGAGGRPACVAFAGDLGGQCSCTVYVDRPSVCGEYEVGGQLCLKARQLAGLPL